ncbi:MAG: hypothetical protein AAF471_04060 [Myxococcota bacterium]
MSRPTETKHPSRHPDERSEEGSPQPRAARGDSSSVLHYRCGQTQNDKGRRYATAQDDQGKNHPTLSFPRKAPSKNPLDPLFGTFSVDSANFSLEKQPADLFGSPRKQESIEKEHGGLLRKTP